MKKIIFTTGCVLAILSYVIFSYMSTYSSKYPADKMYFCTAADERFFPHLLNLIGSIHKIHFNDTQEIAVFDLGLKQEQRRYLDTVDKVVVCDVELTTPDLLKKIECRPGKMTLGWYAWKPVCLKQALDMYPFVLWLDAGSTVINSLAPIFEVIKEQGSFLTECGHNIRVMATQRVIDKFKLTSSNRSWILDESTQGAAAGIIGVSHKYYKDFVYPFYKLTHSLDLFIDDGSAAGGPGWGRYEQTILSVYAQLLKLPIYTKDFNIAQDNHDHIYQHVKVAGNDIQLHITEIPRQVHEKTTIFCSRNFMPWFNQLASSIKFKSQGIAHETHA